MDGICTDRHATELYGREPEQIRDGGEQLRLEPLRNEMEGNGWDLRETMCPEKEWNVEASNG